jgi:hypothetical protein
MRFKGTVFLTMSAIFLTSLIGVESASAITCKSPAVLISKATTANYTNASSWAGSLSISMNIGVSACAGSANGKSAITAGSISVTPVIGASSNNPVESVKTSSTRPITRSSFSDCVMSQGGLFISPAVVEAARNSDPKLLMTCMVFTSTTTARVDISTKSVSLPKVKIGGGQKASYPYALIVTTVVAPNGQILATVQ